MAARRRFSNAVYEIERLSQVRADLDRSLGKYYTECLRQSTETTHETSDEWMRKAENAQTFRCFALADLDKWITELSGTDANTG